MALDPRNDAPAGRWRRRAGLAALATAALLVVPPVLGVVGAALGESGADVAGVVVGDVVLLLVCRALLRRWERPSRLVLGPPPSARELRSCLGLAVATLGVSCGTMWCTAVGLHWIAPDAAALLLDEEPLLNAPPGLATLLALDAVLAAPILEEWLFRGVLLPAWSRRFGVLRAVAMSSVLFGALHADPLGAAVFGWIAALLYLRSGSLWSPIVFHVVHNAAVVMLALTGTELPAVAEVVAWWPTAAVAGVLGAAVVATWVRAGAPATAPVEALAA